MSAWGPAVLVAAVIRGALDTLGPFRSFGFLEPAPLWVKLLPFVLGFGETLLDLALVGWVVAGCWAAATGQWPRLRRFVAPLIIIFILQLVIGFFGMMFVQVANTVTEPLHAPMASSYVAGFAVVTLTAMTLWLFLPFLDARKAKGRRWWIGTARSVMWAFVLCLPLVLMDYALGALGISPPWSVLASTTRRIVGEPLFFMSLVVAYHHVWPGDGPEAIAA